MQKNRLTKRAELRIEILNDQTTMAHKHCNIIKIASDLRPGFSAHWARVRHPARVTVMPAHVEIDTVSTAPLSIPKADITAVVLAGGRGSRMGGVDKGLVPLIGRPMVAHVIARLRPQVGDLLINANRNVDQYATLGFPVIQDFRDGFLGPPAGMASGLAAAATPYIVTVPCDSPLVGTDLVERLARALMQEHADIAVAHDGERAHPVFLLLRRDLYGDLTSFLETGGRKIDRWFEWHRIAYADFHDVPEAFVNVNDPDERQNLERQLASVQS